MLNSVRSLSWVLVLTLAACGDGGPAADSGTSNNGSGASKTPRRHALATLTADRLDDYVDVLQAAAAAPDKKAMDIALARGWNMYEWTMLHLAVEDVTADGGFDAMLARLRDKVKRTGNTMDEQRKSVAAAPEAQRAMIAKGLETLERAMSGWKRTLAEADELRAGAELIESRMAEIKAIRTD